MHCISKGLATVLASNSMKYMAGLGLHCSEATILNRIRRFHHSWFKSIIFAWVGLPSWEFRKGWRSVWRDGGLENLFRSRGREAKDKKLEGFGNGLGGGKP